MPTKIPTELVKLGSKLYRQNRVTTLVHACDVHQYNVKTDKKYLVTIHLSCDKKIISVNCSCHHGQDNVYCEHIAAALYKLSADLELNQKVRPTHFRRYYKRETDKTVLYNYLKKQFNHYVYNCNPINNKAVMVEMENFLQEYNALYTDDECFRHIDKMIVNFFLETFKLTPLYNEIYLKLMNKAFINNQLFNLDHIFYEINTHIPQYSMERACINTIKRIDSNSRKDYLYDWLCRNKEFYKCDRHQILLKHADPDTIYEHFVQTYVLLNNDVDQAYEYYCQYKNEFTDFDVSHIEEAFKNK